MPGVLSHVRKLSNICILPRGSPALKRGKRNPQKTKYGKLNTITEQLWPKGVTGPHVQEEFYLGCVNLKKLETKLLMLPHFILSVPKTGSRVKQQAFPLEQEPGANTLQLTLRPVLQSVSRGACLG